MSAFDDYLAAAPDGGAQPASFDAYVGTPVAATPAPIKAAPTPSNTPTIDSVWRQLGLTARAGVTGLAGLPTMFGDATNGAINLGIHGINALIGSHIAPMQMPSSMLQNAMTAAGVPTPANATERRVQAVSSAMAGTAPFVKAGQLIANAASPLAVGSNASPVVQAVGNGMSALPGMQVTGAAGAALGGDVAREHGYGPIGQMTGGLLGALLGSIAPSAALASYRGAQNLANNVSGVVQPLVSPQKYVGNQLAQTIGPDAASTVAQNIRNAPEYVPGSLPTTAQAGANPTLVATEKSLANTSPEFKQALAGRSDANNAARWRVLQDVAQTPDALTAATNNRDAAVRPLYDAAANQTANVGNAFMTLAQRPAMVRAMQQAQTLAANRGETLVWPQQGGDMSISGSALDYTKQALSDMVASAKASGNKSEGAGIADALDRLNSWTQRYIPAQREAARTYAQMSPPINTMQAGQQIAGALGTRAMDSSGLPQISLMPYRSALTKAIGDQEYGIDPTAHAALQGIGQDLQRATISNSLRSPGSDTAYNIAANGWLARQIYGQNFGGATGLGRALGAIGATVTGHPYIGAGLLLQGNRLGQLAGNRLNAQLSELMLDPQGLLPYLDAVQPQQAPQALLPRLGRDVSQGLLGALAAPRPAP